ncbi:hypothetical protein BDW22DRAFT_274302 [Trametopsis cervina]|nr:hypothetical protein BDW22DRAFT_274302 [Trametopsis cervina]
MGTVLSQIQWPFHVAEACPGNRPVPDPGNDPDPIRPDLAIRLASSLRPSLRRRRPLRPRRLCRQFLRLSVRSCTRYSVVNALLGPLFCSWDLRNQKLFCTTSRQGLSERSHTRNVRTFPYPGIRTGSAAIFPWPASNCPPLSCQQAAFAHIGLRVYPSSANLVSRHSRVNKNSGHVWYYVTKAKNVERCLCTTTVSIGAACSSFHSRSSLNASIGHHRMAAPWQRHVFTPQDSRAQQCCYAQDVKRGIIQPYSIG